MEDYPTQERIITAARNSLFMQYPNNMIFLNSIALGQIIACLDTVIAEESCPSAWNCVHPRIKKASMKLYLDGHFANAAEDAFIEINDAVKEIHRKRHPEMDAPDGVNLMHKVFGGNDLLLADIETEMGSNIQQGFHFLFSGGMSAFRNLKAHSNKEQVTA